MTHRYLQVEDDGHVRTIRFNRPEVMNALDDPTQHELFDALSQAAAEAQVRVVILTGAGKAFSAGGDLDAVRAALDNPTHFLDTVPQAKKLVFTMLEFPKPIIAKINGAAVGLGATVALLCDITYAADHARIIDPHVQIGLVAGDGGALLWPQLLGYNRAKEYLYTGDPIPAPEAERLGLINRCVPAAELDERVRTLAQRIAATPPRAVQGTKATINIPLREVAQAVMDAGMAYETVTSRSHDHREAVMALLEKRKPSFNGN